MKKILLLLSCLMMVSINLLADYSTDWIKPADNYLKTGVMIARDKKDNVVVTGYIQTENIYTRKYDKFGNFLWEKSSASGISNNYEKPVWVNTDNNNNIYVVGYRYTWSSSWEYPNAVVVLKYNAAGTLLWKQIINVSYVVGKSTGLRFSLRSDVDSNGNLYIGTVGTNPAGFIFIKLSASGAVLVNTTRSLGTIHGFGSMRLQGNKVILTGAASVNSNVAVVAWDTAGSFLWSKILNGFSGKDVEIDGSGNAYILTTYPDQVSATSGNDIVIYKFNPAGVQTWKKSYDFGGEEVATRFTLVSNKVSVIGFGSLNSYLDWITFQINTTGTMLWSARYNKTTENDEQPYFLSAKANGEVFVTGKGGPLFEQNGSSYLRMVTLKYGNTGAVQWVDTLNIYSGWGIACTLASDSSLFVLSTTKMTAFHFLDHTGTGSCAIPANLNVTNITNTSARFSWSPVSGAYLYHLRYKTISAAEWTTVSTNLTSIKIKTLTAGTSYNYKVEAVCNSGPSGYSDSLKFTTTGTGYCTTGGESTASEYLTLVWIGAIQNSTGSNNGYGDFTTLSTDLAQGSSVSGYLQATLPYGETEFYRIWIDYNHDNDFTDANEQAVNISSPFLGYIAVNFTVPANAAVGPTRMRVTMQHGGAPSPCGAYPRGETEDYTVNITPQQMNNAAPTITLQKMNNAVSETLPQVSVFPNPATNLLTAKFSGYKGKVTVQVLDFTGKIIFITHINAENKFQLNSGPFARGIYLLRVTDEQGRMAIAKWIKE